MSRKRSTADASLIAEMRRPSPVESSAVTAERLVAAAAEIDQSLLDWSLSLSLRERLRACSNAARALAKFERAQAEDR